MSRLLVSPRGLSNASPERGFIMFKNFSVMESCSHVETYSGSIFLEDHLLLVVIKGTYTLFHDGHKYVLHKNEMVLLRKAITINYVKEGEPSEGNIYEFMFFFLKDSFLKEFIQSIKIHAKPADEMVPVTVISVDRRFTGFIESLKPYMNEKGTMDENLIKLKMFELLYDIGNINKNLLNQLLQLNRRERQNLEYVLENNYMNPVTIEDLAYLSGRSLSGFKRDFNTLYNMPPSRWVRERRLARARELLETTEMTVTDVCFASGFENVSHFSRLFRKHYGHSPSALRKD